MAISLLAWFAEGAHGLPVDVVVIALIVVANALIGFLQESKAESAVAALASMTAVMSTVLRDGRLMSVPAGELVRGDLLVLSEGDSVGADGRLVSATGLRIQESSLTGESEAVEKNTDTLPGKASIGDRLNMVYKGTAVVQGVGRAVVTATGMDTEMGAIADLLERTESEPSPLQTEIAQVSKTLGLAVIGIAVVVMVALAVLNGVQTASDLVTILLLGVSLAVAAVPEGLPDHPVARAGHRSAGAGEAQRRHEGPALGGDPRLGVRDLLGQDRHPHPQRDDAARGGDGVR